MDDKGEGCHRKHPETPCRLCGSAPLAYWCETCERPVPEKRCPFCGLKARKVRRDATHAEA